MARASKGSVSESWEVVCEERETETEKKKKREAEDSAELENEFTVDPRPPKPIASENSEADAEAEEENGNEPIYTAYSLRALPFGGYVSMEGENADSNDPNALSNKNVWQRMFIMIAGPAMKTPPWHIIKTNNRQHVSMVFI